MANQRIAGQWRGHYQVPRFPEHDSAFTAYISENGGQIEGAIEDDCELGEATLLGTFSFPSVQFTKVYLKEGQINVVEKRGDKTVIVSAIYGPPIDYRGTMSEDGLNMSGTWAITGENAQGKGTWTAYRLDEKEKDKSKDTTAPTKVRKMEEVPVEVS